MPLSRPVYWGSNMSRRRVGEAILRDDGTLTLRINGDPQIQEKIRAGTFVSNLQIGEPDTHLPENQNDCCAGECCGDSSCDLCH